MKLETFILGISLVAYFPIIRAIEFKDNGYYDVLVAISPDVEANHDERVMIVENIKKWISSGSAFLYAATKRQTYMAKVNILLPQSWTDIDDVELTTEYNFNDGAIRVDLPSALYLDTPYTVQPGGCGDPGEYTHVTPAFLEHLDGSTTDVFGPPGKVYVREWAKFRYGVFEEYGYPGDNRYPMFYYDKFGHMVPNYCTDENLEGYPMDMSNGGTCTLVAETGLPNDDCIFVIDSNKNEYVSSSYMAVNFLPSVTEFCESSEVEYFYHDPFKPTKQNLMCNGQAIWEVINQHDDFNPPITPLDKDNPPETEFHILRQEEARYVMVLDTSGSMDDNTQGRYRITRMIEAATNFVQFYVNDGSVLGVTHFSTHADVDFELTVIADDTRISIAEKIRKYIANGGTCLGLALDKGLEVLYGDEGTNGGVIMYLTDGKEDCGGNRDPKDKDDIPGGITNEELLQKVVDRKVRIITMAFGKDADENLENLAKISGGQTFFIPDGYDNEDINDAFRAAMAYDPAVPSSEKEILIYSKSFSGKNLIAEGGFVIDASIGNQMKFELNYNLDDEANPKMHITLPNGTIVDHEIDTTIATSFYTINELMQVGEYSYRIEMKENKLERDSFIDVRITTKARDEAAPPFETRCWTSTGNEDIDASKKNLVVQAQVFQGPNAIINAPVTAYIMREGQDEPVSLKLSDNGRGADLIAEDGIYSAYFTDYNDVTGRYTLECQTMNDNDEAVVIKPESNRATGMVKTLHDNDLGPQSPPCCGSTTSNVKVSKEKTGKFERKSSGGSFKVIGTPSGKDSIAPARILDLEVTTISPITESDLMKLEVKFTSPGDDLDDGKASKYELRFINSKTLNDSKIDFDKATPILQEDLISGSLDAPLGSGEVVTLEFDNTKMNEKNTAYFLLVRAVDEENNAGDDSNNVRFCNDCEGFPSSANMFTTGLISKMYLSLGLIYLYHLF